MGAASDAWKPWARHCVSLVFAVPLAASLMLQTEEAKARVTDVDHITFTVLNYVGDASFALTGSLAAGMEGMDLLGCILVGFVTALGGGSFRDLVVGRLPLFWLQAWDEALLSVAVGAASFVFWPPLSRRWRLTSADEWLFWTDTLGLAVFAANGAYMATTEPKLHSAACACCGMMTATFGGMMRDVLIARPVRIMYAHAEVYALPALLGGVVTTCFLRLSPTWVSEALLLGAWSTAAARVLAVNHDLRLPTFPARAVYSEAARPRDAAALRARQEELRWKQTADAATRAISSCTAQLLNYSCASPALNGPPPLNYSCSSPALHRTPPLHQAPPLHQPPPLAQPPPLRQPPPAAPPPA